MSELKEAVRELLQCIIMGLSYKNVYYHLKKQKQNNLIHFKIRLFFLVKYLCEISSKK